MTVGAAHQNWQSLGASGLYGGATSYGAGGYGSAATPHDKLDALRMGIGRIPSAEYPDGYLGTMRTRREDRVLDSLKERVNQRSYQRGVHKGERIEPSSYFYPEGFEPDRGLAAQAVGQKQAPLMHLVPPPKLVNDGKTKVDIPHNVPGEINPRRSQQFAHMRPNWR